MTPDSTSAAPLKLPATGPAALRSVSDRAALAELWSSGLIQCSVSLTPDDGPPGRLGVQCRSTKPGVAANWVAPPDCALCGRSAVQPKLRFDKFVIGVCNCCGAGMVLDFDRLSSQEIDSYSENYAHELRVGKAEQCWKLVLERTGQLAGIRSVLDIGCGEGAFLDLARQAGLQTAGMELSPQAAAAAVFHGHEIFCGSIEQTSFPADRTFDLVTLWDVIEHLDQPRAALECALQSLAPNGRLIVITPRMGSVYDRLGIALYRISGSRGNPLLRMCWTVDHRFRFDRRGLAEVLKSLGCARVDVQPILLLSLRPDVYAGGKILRSWTGSSTVDRWISRLGVQAARALRISNKAIVVAQRSPGDA